MKTILVIEDTPHILKELLAMLKKEFSDCKIIAFTDGFDAGEYLLDSNNKVDIIVSDNLMPKWTGKRLFEEITTNHTFNKYKNTPFIFQTSVPDDVIHLTYENLNVRVLNKYHQPIKQAINEFLHSNLTNKN